MTYVLKLTYMIVSSLGCVGQKEAITLSSNKEINLRSTSTTERKSPVQYSFYTKTKNGLRISSQLYSIDSCPLLK